MARRSKNKSLHHVGARDEPVYYVVEVSDWAWSLMFGVSPRRDIDRGPYSDYRHLHLYGKLLRPTKLKAEKVEVTFLPDRQLNEGQREKREPRGVGSFRYTAGRFTPCYLCPPTR